MRITDRLPAPLSERIASATVDVFNPQGREVDIAVAGIPFRLATAPDFPQSVETIPVRRDQFDTETDPGEQSLTSWWRRSQASWHEGAGDLYQENRDRNIDSVKFYDSLGVDVFTPGQITLLKKMGVWTDGAPDVASRIRTYASSSVRTNLCTNPSAETDTTDITAGGSAPPTITRSNEQASVGGFSFKIVWDTGGTLPNMQMPTLTTTTGTRYTVSVEAHVVAGSPAVQIVIPDAGLAGFSTATTIEDDFQRISVTWTAVDSSTTPQIWPETPPTSGDVAYIDAILYEQSNVLGGYFDGSSPNSEWTGTTDLSTSTETITAAGVSVSVVGDGELFTADEVDGTLASLHAPASAVVDGLVSSGFFYDITADGTLYQGSTGAPGSATDWDLGATPYRLGWGKHRLWVIGGRNLWQPDLSLPDGDPQPALFTHPNQGWTYTCLTEGASAMLFGGHDGFASTIQSVVLESNGDVPTLSGAAVTAALPDGELIQELSVLAGQFVGIGTNRGFRMGVIDNAGQITYGPLIIEPDGVLECTALTAQSRFFVVSFRTDAGEALAYRVDTGNPLDGDTFPYAKDINCDFIGAITSLAAPSSTRLIATTANGEVWAQSETDYVETGFLETGRIRYRTTEPKSFKSLSVEIEPLAGNIACSLIKEGGSTLTLGSITDQGQIFDDKFTISDEKMRYASVRFELAPDEDGTSAPVIHSYQLRAIPAVKPQRMIQLPLLCFDKEKSASGQWYGGKDFAADRLAALHLLEDDADVVLYQDFTSLNSGGQFVTIESIRYVQTAPNASHKATANGNGGIVFLQLRTVET